MKGIMNDITGVAYLFLAAYACVVAFRWGITAIALWQFGVKRLMGDVD